MTATFDGRQLIDGQPAGEREADLPDLTDMSLADLLAIDNPVLAAALTQVAAADDGQGIVAGFQSAI
jgi:FXSXX-COOH protein